MKVIEGRIISSFGQSIDPIRQGYQTHQGIDIEATEGTSVYSPTDGVVVSVFTNVVSGVTLIISSDCRKVRFAMSHLRKATVREGAFVERGQLVAYSGNSGRSTGAHLHFSVKTGGRWYAEQYVGGAFTDPVPYIEQRVASTVDDVGAPATEFV